MKKILKFIMYAFLVLIGIGILSAIFGGGDEETTDPAPDTDEELVEEGIEEEAPEEEAPEEEAPEEEDVDEVAGIGDTIELEEMSYTVHGVDKATQVGENEFLTEEAGSGAIFYVIDVEVHNGGSESVTVDSNLFSLVTEDGTTYDPDSMATQYANEGGAAFFLESVNPGLSLEGNLVFEVPEGLQQDELSLNVREGIFSTNEGLIRLSE
ncbi:DUF4352 domain-containing protein [Texcoconibacillus texcoconensis]|uniref:DUF4352 domain-containing protein n=1 Tax=Texcoconibacillus texcoconensis TaxID=1095777 RepID=A0A840QM78_9BACI|nr:DUF4352 domain-containing protein [Texcoconibacillus texcoconensis]MBB5172482.1 hypothetical protein [Texcoconibacillus texcoconensis]